MKLEELTRALKPSHKGMMKKEMCEQVVMHREKEISNFEISQAVFENFNVRIDSRQINTFLSKAVKQGVIVKVRKGTYKAGENAQKNQMLQIEFSNEKKPEPLTFRVMKVLEKSEKPMRPREITKVINDESVKNTKTVRAIFQLHKTKKIKKMSKGIYST